MTVNQSQLDAGLAQMTKMTVNKSQLDAGLAQLVTNVTAIGTALNQFIADYNAKTGVDLTSELATVTGLVNQTATATSNIVAADPAA